MTIDQIVADLRNERDLLNRAIAALESSSDHHGRGPSGTKVSTQHPRMSAAAGARIAAAQRGVDVVAAGDGRERGALAGAGVESASRLVRCTIGTMIVSTTLAKWI
ncbi:MAG: hypothetical protein JO187_10560 [Acidobacteria bacterium]|nr:hypothetical protein [Acidobacteriota bacterium]